MDFSEKILYIRSRNNLSQSDLAKHLNVSYATISRWENGKSNPTKKDLLTFHRYCAKEKINFEEFGYEK